MREPSPDELDLLTQLRRDMHAHLELGFEEARTSDLVAGLLEEAGIPVHRGLGKTGVVGSLQVGDGLGACSVQAGDRQALNVIPDFVKIAGTARAYTPAVRDQLEEEIGRLATGVATMFAMDVDYRLQRRIPPVVNDDKAVARAQKAAEAVCGAVRTNFPPSTAGDDFAFFSQQAPGAYVWLGNGPADDGALHHNTGYDFNDAAIATGVQYWSRLVEQELAS